MNDKPPTSVSFSEALRYWFKLGCISFGGPAGQIAIMHQELVDKRRWISEHRFLHALNYCMVLPGPEAQQLATYIGWLMHGIRGGIAAGVLFVLPSLVLMIGLSWLYVTHSNTPWMSAIFYGIKPAVTAIVFHAAWRIGSRTLKTPVLWGVAALSLLATVVLHLPFPVIVLSAACAGWLTGRFWPHAIASGKPSKSTDHGHSSNSGDINDTSLSPSIIDDHSPTPEHAQFRPSHALALGAAGVALWSLPLLGLLALWGITGTFTQMGWFFTKAALLTFGGAYAVLPYVFHAAVGHYAWLSAAQMLDGLALGETTPGPLIMIVSFVGFLGGWNLAPLGLDQQLLSGVIGACIATWFTFLPSFVFIFTGAPWIEKTRQQVRLTAPLTFITAAVTGVIVNLGFFFGMQVWWPSGFDASADWFSIALSALALLAFVKYQQGVIRTLVVCAALGAVWKTATFGV